MNITIGTRGSRLALWQSDHIAGLLHEKLGLECRKMIIKTTGDKITDVPLAKIGGKGLFVKELDDAVLDGRVDFAVHSLKDVPVDLPPGLTIACVPEREETNDAWLSGYSLKDLPENSIIGTSSLRRIAQMKNYRPDIQIKDLRGNVDTRLRKLEEGRYDGIIMAKAGLKRLGFEENIRETLSTEVFTPTVGQGAIAVVAREDYPGMDNLRALNDRPTEIRVEAERSLLRALGGGCQIPLGARTEVTDKGVELTGVMLSQDGGIRIEAYESGPDPLAVGRIVADKLIDQGGMELLRDIEL